MVDFEKFPILYEEETREKVEKFIFENFELREAFARDIKDMLQEFIDMGDIDYEDDEDCEDE